MKTSPFRKIVKCLVPAAAVFCSVAFGANETNVVSKIHAQALVKSVFVDDPRAGLDPFFPNSARRAKPVEEVSPTNSIPQPNMLLQQLSLKGISGTKSQRLALINSATVSVGELAEIRCGIQIVKIRCLEIRDRSVLITLDGASEVKELKLREGI